MNKNELTVSAFFQWANTHLREKKISTHQIDTEIIMAYALRGTRENLYTDNQRRLNKSQTMLLNELISRRAKNEPVAYITGLREFYGLQFEVSPDVLIPRPESELLVEEILQFDLQDRKVLDICTGSGNLGISIKKYCPQVQMTCSDISEQALQCARTNAELILGQNDIIFIKSNVYSDLKEKYDYIISNPPYIPSAELKLLQEDVRNFEPQLALDGGSDGLFFYNSILSELKQYLNTGGYIFLELNPFLKEEIIKFVRDNKIKLINIKKDYSCLERVLIGKHEKEI